MKRYFSILLFVLLYFIPDLGLGHGYSTSKINEVIHNFKGIYVVQINDVRIEYPGKNKQETGAYINISFLVTEVLKGEKINFKKATCVKPSIRTVLKDGSVMKRWIKINGSGIEENMKKGKQYIVYFTENGMQNYKGKYFFQRADPINRKNQVLRFIKGK